MLYDMQHYREQGNDLITSFLISLEVPLHPRLLHPLTPDPLLLQTAKTNLPPFLLSNIAFANLSKPNLNKEESLIDALAAGEFGWAKEECNEGALGDAVAEFEEWLEEFDPRYPHFYGKGKLWHPRDVGESQIVRMYRKALVEEFGDKRRALNITLGEFDRQYAKVLLGSLASPTEDRRMSEIVDEFFETDVPALRRASAPPSPTKSSSPTSPSAFFMNKVRLGVGFLNNSIKIASK
ncbi:hypothetical protein HDV00_002355 [Rhizophlyctis rosea]|nr:hypothetical protein HDV00_002355 [Rhizophlyctis rosea]